MAPRARPVLGRGAIELPSPGVRFPPNFRARLARLVALSASRRERQGGEGGARALGGGAEFVGYRPYRLGEDLRALDWNLYARLRRPYVRVSAREASEQWVILLDASASMGVGRPGKLQLAAELALAFAALALRRGAGARLFVRGAEPLGTARRPAALEGWMRSLEALRAEGEDGLGSLVRALGALRGAGRWFLLGDFCDCEPREVFRLARPARELVLAQLLAREELHPPLGSALRWVDPESARALSRAADAATVGRYERALAERLEGWRVAALQARALHGCWSSATPFEEVALELCARAD
jgi:uncharacterized protein (DUF58 family)